MGKVSTVKRLDVAIRDEVHRLLEHGQTLDTIVAHLRGLGVNEVSRSALGRYKKNFDQVMERVRRSREIADALVRQYGKEDESKAMRANIEMMHSIVSDMLLQIGDNEDGENEGRHVVLDPKQAHDLAKALDHLGRAKRHDQDALVKAREEAAKATEAKLIKAVDTIEGESTEPMTVAQMKERMLAVYRGEA